MGCNRAKAQLSQVYGRLIGSEFATGQQNIKEPVVQIRWLRAFMIKKKTGLRLLSQDPVLYFELIIIQFNLMYIRKFQSFEIST
jgi:hypothetical protein